MERESCITDKTIMILNNGLCIHVRIGMVSVLLCLLLDCCI